MLDKDLVFRARRADLAVFFRSQGYALRAYRSRRGVQYKVLHHGGLFVRDHMFYQFSTGLSGNAVDCLVHVLGYSFAEAVEILANLPSSSADHEPSCRPADSVSMPDRAPDVKRIYAYLIQKRGLDPEIVSLLIEHKLLYQDVHGNAVFVHYDDVKRPIGGEIHGTTEKKFKGVVEGTSHSSFTIQKGAGKKVYLFESAIDLLSYVQMYRYDCDDQDVIYASMAGLKKEAAMQFIRDGYTVVSMVDNDMAGVIFNKSLRIHLDFPDAKIVVGKNHDRVYGIVEGKYVFCTEDDRRYVIGERMDSLILEDHPQFSWGIDPRLRNEGCKDWNELLLKKK